MIGCILFSMVGFAMGVLVTSILVGYRMRETDRLIEVLRHECGAPDTDEQGD